MRVYGATVSEANPPPFRQASEAFKVFASGSESVQSQKHIKPLHQHIAIRLVVEGGFHPDEITPRPPLRVERGTRLVWDAEASDHRERTVMGGLKTKDIDVVVMKEGIGPVIAVSVKGTTGAFRNLTNRMEEAIGDSTNLHVMYPGLVYGFYQVIRANTPDTPGLRGPNDVAVDGSGQVCVALRRYHDALMNLTGRRLIRDDPTSYEAVALAFVSPDGDKSGSPLSLYPEPDSPLRPEGFFATLFKIYDMRYPYMAPSLRALRRGEWCASSPVFESSRKEGMTDSAFGYAPRVSGET